MNNITTCFPLKKCNDNNNIWEIIEEKIGEESKYGDVYQVCCEKNCDYVLKIQVDKKKYNNEVNIHYYIQNILPKLVPILVDNFECNNNGLMIIEKMDITLYKALDIIINQDASELQILKSKIKIQNLLIDMVKVLHDYAHVIHNDLHGNNIMCKINPDYIENEDDLYEMFMEWRIIDFGNSKYIDDLPNKIDAVHFANEDYTTFINNIIDYDGSKNLN